MTCDMWHVIRDKWHVTHDIWHMTHGTFGGVNILSKFQLPSSYRLWFMILWRSGGKGSVAEWINQSINDEAVYRTAPATPGLLNMLLSLMALEWLLLIQYFCTFHHLLLSWIEQSISPFLSTDSDTKKHCLQLWPSLATSSFASLFCQVFVTFFL